MRLPGVTDYRQNHVLESAPGLGAGLYRVDGIVELWFAADDVVHAGFDSDVADRLILDEQEFLSGLTGGPVTAGAPHAPWPFKLWVLARWRDGTENGLRRLTAGRSSCPQSSTAPSAGA